MSRVFTIEELNKIINELIEDAKEEFSKANEKGIKDILMGKIIGLQDLSIELNDPKATINVTETVQQSLNAITAQNIINNEL